MPLGSYNLELYEVFEDDVRVLGKSPYVNYDLNKYFWQKFVSFDFS